MDRYIVVIAAVAVLVVLSVIINQRMGDLTKLPMQWGLDGRPTWYAPRWVALAFTPALGSVVLVAVTLKAQMSTGVVLVVAATFVAAHALYLAVLFRKPRR